MNLVDHLLQHVSEAEMDDMDKDAPVQIALDGEPIPGLDLRVGHDSVRGVDA
jgi:hypothetical protein